MYSTIVIFLLVMAMTLWVFQTEFISVAEKYVYFAELIIYICFSFAFFTVNAGMLGRQLKRHACCPPWHDVDPPRGGVPGDSVPCWAPAKSLSLGSTIESCLRITGEVIAFSENYPKSRNKAVISVSSLCHFFCAFQVEESSGKCIKSIGYRMESAKLK